MEAVSNPQTLAQTGLETIRLFGKVKNIDKLPSLNLAEEWPKALFAGESDRFELWAVNLGLFVAGHGSLSYRLREAERLESTIRRFMEDLNSSLVEVLEYCAGEPDNLVDESQIASTSRPFSEFLDDDQNEENVEDQESDIDLLFDSVKDPIDRLFKITTRIRNPSSRLGSSKALRHQQIDEESGIDLLQRFENYDHDYISTAFLQYQKTKALQQYETLESSTNPVGEGEEISVWEPIRTVLFNHAKGKESFLVRRIAHANTRRRQNFAYWKKHREKLATHAKAFTVNAAMDAIAALEFPGRASVKSVPTATSVKSVTTATLLNNPHIVTYDNRSTVSVSEYASSAWKPGKEIVDFPPAPSRDPEEKFFECPYCFTLCPAETLGSKAWKAHLIHDLRPYICTYEHCRNHDLLYDTRHDWIQHENTHRSVWRCPEHPELISTTLEHFREHQRTNHPEWNDEEMQRSLIYTAETTLEVPDRRCPICSLELESAKALHSHVGLHLERFSIFALPRGSVDQEDEESNEGDSDKANIAYEGSRGDDFDSDLDFQSAGSDNSYEMTVNTGTESDRILEQDSEAPVQVSIGLNEDEVYQGSFDVPFLEEDGTSLQNTVEEAVGMSSPRPRMRRGSSLSNSATAWSEWEWNDPYQCESRYRKTAAGGYEWEYRQKHEPRKEMVTPAIEDPTRGLESMNTGYQSRLIRGDNRRDYERFDKSYKIHKEYEFKQFRVFKVLWSEPSSGNDGSSESHDTISVRDTRYGPTHEKVRRFMILSPMRGHCLCLPINTYLKQGTLKNGVNAEHHTIVYTSIKPEYLNGEWDKGMTKQAIRIDPATPRDKLEPQSRLNYARVYTVEYNVKVCFIGKVHVDSRSQVVADYNATHPALTYGGDVPAPAFSTEDVSQAGSWNATSDIQAPGPASASSPIHQSRSEEPDQLYPPPVGFEGGGGGGGEQEAEQHSQSEDSDSEMPLRARSIP